MVGELDAVRWREAIVIGRLVKRKSESDRS
jgi:hypothetical protein